jgi:CRP/FNR family cyclic AMP-dependent transcriptional regulator
MNSSTTPDKYVESSGGRLSADFEHLRHSPIFSGINLDVVKLFAYLSTHRSYKDGDLLAESGQKADQAFIVINGLARITIQHRGRTIPLQDLEKDSFFGELALLAQFKWFFNAQARGDLEVIIIDRQAFQKVIEKYPEHKDKLIERMVQLRVERLISQTSFMLDQLIDNDDKSEKIWDTP